MFGPSRAARAETAARRSDPSDPERGLTGGGDGGAGSRTAARTRQEVTATPPPETMNAGSVSGNRDE
jgi:hypothetical protein